MNDFHEIKLKDFYPCLGCGARTEPWGIYTSAQESPFCRACWEKMSVQVVRRDVHKATASNLGAVGKSRRQFLTCGQCETTHLVNVPADVDHVDGFLCKACSRKLAADLETELAETREAGGKAERKRSVGAQLLIWGIALAFVAVVVAAVSVAVVAARWALGI